MQEKITLKRYGSRRIKFENELSLLKKNFYIFYVFLILNVCGLTKETANQYLSTYRPKLIDMTRYLVFR